MPSPAGIARDAWDGRGLTLVGVVPVVIAITWNVNENAPTSLPGDSWHR